MYWYKKKEKRNLLEGGMVYQAKVVHTKLSTWSCTVRRVCVRSMHVVQKRSMIYSHFRKID